MKEITFFQNFRIFNETSFIAFKRERADCKIAKQKQI